MTIEYGVTPQGFRTRRLIDVKNQLEDLFISEFGDVNLEPQSVIGQLIGIFSKVLADDWENLQDVYLSQYPNSASGVSLDNVVQLNGLTRIAAQRTSVIGVATGAQNTLIPSGSLARLSSTNEIFFSTQTAFISNSNAVANTVNVLGLSSQVYTVLINTTAYIFSLPIISFSGFIVPGNIINVRINGINMPAVPYNTSSAQTLSDLSAAILSNSPAVATATVLGNTIKLVPELGFQIIVNSINVSGVGAPTGSVVLDAPLSTSQVAEYLSANINNGSNVNSSWTSPNSFFSIQASSTEFPYSLNVGSNLQITSVSSPVPFLSQSFGPIPAPAGSLTNILTPVSGWTSLTNFDAGITGRNQETDTELRIRRALSLKVQGAATVESIISRLRQEVPGVTSVNVFENVTMTQDPISVIFSQNFVTGNLIQVQFESLNIGTVPFNVSQLQTMNDIADLIETQEEIKQVTVTGVGNRELTLEMEDGQDIQIEFNITGGATQSTYSISGGRPPKSFETVVEGGSDQAVALKIWQLKPAGIETFGNTHIVITDSQGNLQGINFTRATPVYIWVNVVLTLNPQETFPANGQQLVSQAILLYGNSLGIGIDVFIQRVLAQVFTVGGIASAVVQLARTGTPSETPVFSSTDIDIGPTEISTWDIGRITVSI